ncbi:PREDICTED: two pore calcium channel protein 1A-like [Ipomoea nil]|uniref:two pore calcium channel protein 1A-like n=1 Tax=Ipomoea nil TaxID=35883 RepID=UPI000900B4E9|nr:PREDICTED: two pore calcium channel protein 1A-like [Ipomoea nil]XP_019194319.1 PREDICTED: two pore calcium channel protein 1A-like [Ipomoea nil]XP_019194320.1 PREDICTED: two pore calcium channel protein 1A-like [Ipomoea nil]
METALLSGESSGSGGGSGPLRLFRRRAFSSRSDAIVYGSTYQKAAALVDLAEDGVGIPEEILDQSSFASAAKLYFIFTRFDFLWSLNYFALIVLNFLEKPLWCSKQSAYGCSDRQYYFLGQLPYLTNTGSLVYEGVTLVILVTHALFPISYEGFQIYWRSILNRLKVLLLLVLVADLVVYVLSIAGLYYLPFRAAPYVRVVFFILNIRELRDSIVILAGMSGTYLNVMVLSVSFLLFCSWLGYVIFEDTEQGKTVFTSFGITLYEMFILFTTSNNPDVWIPAYKESRWYCLFFVLYVLLGVYFVTNLILAVVYDSFKSELAKQVAEKDRVRLRTLKKAFSLVDDNNCGFLNKEQCIRLFEELNKYRSLPKISRDDFELIFDELDDTRDFKIDLDEFFDLCNAISLRFQKEDSLPVFETFPNVYHSTTSEKLREFVRSTMFEYIIMFILVINFVAVVIETTLDIADSSSQTFWQKVEFVFGWLYVIEMALKIYTYGFENYWRDGQNRFDFVVTWVIVIGETTTFVAPDGETFLSNGEWIRYLLIARMLRLIRLLMHVRSYRAFVATFLTLIPSLMPYLGTIFCVLCFYCSLGLQIFGGMVNAGNPNLDGTDLSDNDYLLFNFNDYPNGMVTLFNLLVMGNWQLWMQSYKELTGTSWSYVYFISFYVITVLWLLNLIVAFVLEAFQTEMDMETSAICVDGENKEERERERRRKYGTKTRSQRVDALLHHMLSSELTQCSSP